MVHRKQNLESNKAQKSYEDQTRGHTSMKVVESDSDAQSRLPLTSHEDKVVKVVTVCCVSTEYTANRTGGGDATHAQLKDSKKIVFYTLPKRTIHLAKISGKVNSDNQQIRKNISKEEIKKYYLYMFTTLSGVTVPTTLI